MNFNVCAEIHGRYHNYVLTFPVHPTIVQLVNLMRCQFDTVQRGQCPIGRPMRTFCIQSVHVLARGRWEEITTPMQLHHGCQLFCFQAGPGEEVAPGDASPDEGIPDAVPLRLAWYSTRPPPIHQPYGKADPRSTKSCGSPSLPSRILSVFQELDVERKGHVVFFDLARALNTCGIVFSELSPSEVWAMVAKGSGNSVTAEQFATFVFSSAEAPHLVDSLYIQFQDIWVSPKSIK